ncbi:MAG: class I SAM-dependent methyltransferase [Thermoleophilia bacterium]|nr:class I SAM-dependent methyltransferase [Thermoleophilia bacterium]
MDVVGPDLERYAEEHTTPHPPLLDELFRETHETLDLPQMLTGPIEGRFLQFLVWALRAERVLEIGTYSGYSALSMAGGLPEGGHIDTCELEEKHAEVARRYIERAGLSERIAVHVGPAGETIERLGGPWDFVFIDADKEGYVGYYEAVLPKLAAHGLIAADNTLRGGRVLEGDVISEFNDRVRDDPRVVSVLLTVRDGVTLIRRA